VTPLSSEDRGLVGDTVYYTLLPGDVIPLNPTATDESAVVLAHHPDDSVDLEVLRIGLPPLRRLSVPRGDKSSPGTWRPMVAQHDRFPQEGRW
jgi:hypothetical protein